MINFILDMMQGEVVQDKRFVRNMYVHRTVWTVDYQQ